MHRSLRAACAAALAAIPLLASAAPALPRASFLGVQAAPVTDELRAKLRVGDRPGVLIANLVEGGSAKAAGLEPNDVIVEVDGKAVSNPGELVAQLSRHRAGDNAKISWIRNGALETASVVMRPRPYETGPGTRTEYSAIDVNGHLRRTLITGPADEATHPAVLYVTGVGCFSQESLGVQSTEAQLLHGLARAGFITMRVEKSGVGDSQGPSCASPEVDMQAEMAGYIEGIKALKGMPRVRADRVFLLGLSIGGIEAPLIVQREPVRGIVVVNTASKPFMEYLMETRRRQYRLAGKPFDEIDRQVRMSETCSHALLVEKQTPDAILARRPECKEHVQYPAPYTFMQQWAELDMAAEWKRVDAPVLIVQGEQDFVATVADAPLLRDIVESFHPGRATLAMIPRTDHTLTQADSMRESMTRAGPGQFQPKVLEVIADWLRAQVG